MSSKYAKDMLSGGKKCIYSVLQSSNVPEIHYFFISDNKGDLNHIHFFFSLMLLYSIISACIKVKLC